MTKRPLIQAVGDDGTPLAVNPTDQLEGTAEETQFTEEVLVEEYLEDDPAPSRSAWIVPTLAVLAASAWTGFFIFAHLSELLSRPTPAEGSALVAQWAIPVLLIVALWLLAMRNSTREARRFAQVGQSLAEQSRELETRLATVNRELSLAREFLSSQTRDLDYLGRSAVERLSEHSGRLQQLVIDNGEQVESIARVSVNALENMDKLRDNLPVIANSAKDVSNQIGQAGRSAQAQLAELVQGFERLNEFGAASERQVTSLRKRIDTMLESFEAQVGHFSTAAGERFALLNEESETFRADLDSREVDALASIRTRFETLRDELAASEAIAASNRESAMEAVREGIEALRLSAAEVAVTIRTGEDAAIEAWRGQVEAMQERLRSAVTKIAQIDEKALLAANAKLRDLTAEAERVDAQLADRNRIFAEQVARRQSEFEAAEIAAGDALASRLAALDESITERRTAQTEQLAALVRDGEEFAARIGDLGQTFEAVAAQGREARDTLSDAVQRLSAVLGDSREALDGTDMAVSALTDASVRLLELIQASAKHSRDDLPVAMEASEARLAQIEQRADAVKALLEQAHSAGDALTASMDAAGERSRLAIATVDDFQARFGETAAAQVGSIERLRAGVAALGDESAMVAEKAQAELRDAILQLENSAREALSAIEGEQADRIKRIADRVGEQSAEAIDRALSEHTEEAITKLDEATERSAEAGREIMRQLRDQLAKVNELTGNLESRIAHARERATQDVDNDFSRRVALITESLNSNAIDIAKALSTEVTDTAWASYLRGDRGIFTRRAVRLLDNAEAREIAELYDTDHDFREHVSRYIHDFEAMLRTLLSTRDGNAVSVTLLSSDMGKLYVVLAQALERLRQ